AGSGKTRVVTTRIARLLLQGEAPRSILAVTFTNKAAKEMKERLVLLAGKPLARGVWVSTFHSLCARLLRRDAHRIGLSGGFSILDEGDQLAQLSRVARELGLKLAEKEPRMVLSRIGLWKNQGIRRDANPEPSGDPISLLAAQLWKPYGSHLRALGALDFDDLLLDARELLESVDDVRKRYQALFRFIHIDEYQDTNPIQLEITKLLVGHEKNLCVVGDDDQAIYAFRGADLENILAFDKMWDGCKVVLLEENYRSTGLILGAANAVIKKNTVRRNKTLRSMLGAGDPVHIIGADDGDAEAETVGARIFDLVMQQKVPAENVAVLYRAAPQSRLFEESLRLRGVPYRVVGGMEFFRRREVKDTIAYLSCIARPDDEISFRRAVNLPARGLGEKTVERILAGAKEKGVNPVDYAALGALDVPLKDGPRDALVSFASPLVSARKTLAALEHDPDGDFAGAARSAIDDAGLAALVDDETDVAARERLLECIEEVIDALAAFIERLRDADEAPDLAESKLVSSERGMLDAFLDRVSLDDEERDKERDKDDPKKKKGKVQLMSLHASKGLEFPHVFLVGLEEGLLPHRRVLEESGDRGVEEERRLAYVGITRAQRHLVCTWAKARRRRHEIIARRRSRFLDDIPADCRDPEALAPPEPADPAAAFFQTMRERFEK
ncbi:MAG TPA: UvrD-helicase domain-containing protein, partial [Myxococcota bacterium]